MCLLCDGRHMVAQLWRSCESLSTIDARASSRPGGRQFLGQWAALSSLTRLHAINRVIPCSLICNQNLACGEGIGLDYYNVNATTGDYNMAIITLGRLHFMLSCHLAPTDALSVL
jgi:hypothetical protein